ncbi:LysR family transcriptional regulator [Mycobacterium simiae]|uniref:Probable hydrogen peroxide-inducible genes activator n=1 Tax=Mycobacterium simiae TaxID=1784 RepID=A0A1X0XYA1_MYCSI|nr:LysR family transcriptional regulator [Mycobacterium simiae]ORJ57819.1 LysR family transcriptional regulator [Mycobacterium simiae]
MELRQLRYFIAVADELHFSRAAGRLHISGPALSQQIMALERDVGAELLLRDRRGVRLTAAGRSLLQDARRIVGLADDARQRLRLAAAISAPLRLGYVSWLPDDLPALVGPAVALRVDEWVLPSHAQADRVAEGTLDLAVAWVTTTEIEKRGLTADFLCAEPLYAVSPSVGSGAAVAALQVTVLVDADESAWSSWNRFAGEFAGDTGAPIARVDDGGITGEAFYAHVRRIGSPVLASPKRHTAVSPPSLARRPITPTPLWTWSLLRRADDERAVVHHVVETLLTAAQSRHWSDPPERPWWLPSDDPHRARLGTQQ